MNNNKKEREEIEKSILNLFNEMNLCCDSKLFYFDYNYVFDLKGIDNEMDSVFIIKNKRTTNIFIIEYKNYSNIDWIGNNWSLSKKEDLEDKINQIKKIRTEIVDEYENKNIKFYLIFSYLKENKLYYDFFKINKADKHFKLNKDKFNEVFSKIKSNKKHMHLTSNYIYDKLIDKVKDIKFIIDLIQGKKNPIKQKKEISLIWNEIIKKEKNIFLFEGNAGTGKTILAITLFNSLLKKSNLTILFFINQNFADEIKKEISKLDMNKNEKIWKKIMWHTKDFEKWIKEKYDKNKDMYILIDEAQRLKEENLKFLMNYMDKKNIRFFLFGDCKQKIYYRDIGYDLLKQKRNKEIFTKKMEKYFRIDKNTHKAIEYIFFANKNQKEIKFPKNINIFNDPKKYFDKFKKDKSLRAMTSIQNVEFNGYDSILVNNGFRNADKKLHDRNLFLYNKNYLNNIYFYAFDLISREIENIYIFVPEFVKQYSNKIICKNYDDEEAKILLNQFYVLLTRAKKEINVFIVDNEYYEFVIKNKNELKNN